MEFKEKSLVGFFFLSSKSYVCMKNEIIILSDGRKVAIDRSVGVVLLAYIIKENSIYILCNKRGKRTSEYKESWNLPSGYLDWDESGEEAAQRECFEECGIKVPLELIRESEHSTKPTENRQNIIFRYIAKLPIEFFNHKLTSDNSEEDEVVNIKWIKLDDIEKYNFAWKQIETIKRMINKEINPGI